MTTAGKLMFRIMSCFNKMARVGLQPFFQWLSDNSAYSSTPKGGTNDLNRTTVRPRLHALTDKFRISSSLAMGMEFFFRGIPLLDPRIYRLGEIRLPPVLFYSDTEWTVLDKPPWLSKGLGGIMWESRRKPFRSCRGHAATPSGRLEPAQDSDHTSRTDGSGRHVAHLPG